MRPSTVTCSYVWVIQDSLKAAKFVSCGDEKNVQFLFAELSSSCISSSVLSHDWSDKRKGCVWGGGGARDKYCRTEISFPLNRNFLKHDLLVQSPVCLVVIGLQDFLLCDCSLVGRRLTTWLWIDLDYHQRVEPTWLLSFGVGGSPLWDQGPLIHLWPLPIFVTCRKCSTNWSEI